MCESCEQCADAPTLRYVPPKVEEQVIYVSVKENGIVWGDDDLSDLLDAGWSITGVVAAGAHSFIGFSYQLSRVVPKEN